MGARWLYMLPALILSVVAVILALVGLARDPSPAKPERAGADEALAQQRAADKPKYTYWVATRELNIGSIVADDDFQKIDVPVLFGKKFFGVASVFIGPSFQYVLGTDFELDTVNEVSLDQFSLGIQSGFGLEFGKLGIDVRWERGLSNTEASFADGLGNFTIDNRTNQIILGLAYRL